MDSNYRQIKSRPRTVQQYEYRRSRSSGGTTQESTSMPSRAVKILAKSNVAQQNDVPKPVILSPTSTVRTIAQNDNKEATVEKQNRFISNSSVMMLDKHLRIMSTPRPIHSSFLKTTEQHKCYKLIDNGFNFISEPSLENILLTDCSVPNTTATSSNAVSSNSGQSFCVVGAVGLDGVGKSLLLNKIANKQIFKTHDTASEDNLLSHITTGIDIFITAERLFLLDSQPILSASILNELLQNNPSQSSSSFNKPFFYHHHHTSSLSSVVDFEITEPENFAFIYSLQLLTYMIAICDHLILVIDSFSVDAYLIKLLATALMMVGDGTVSKSNLIIYLKQSKAQSCTDTYFKQPSGENISKMETKLKHTLTTLLGPNVMFINNDEAFLINTVLKPPSRNLIADQNLPINYCTERGWLHSAQRYWDNSIRKSTLFSDYAKHMP